MFTTVYDLIPKYMDDKNNHFIIFYSKTQVYIITVR